MNLEHNSDFQKKVNSVRTKHFKELKGCTVRAYLDVAGAKKSSAAPMKIERASAVEKLELGYDLVLVGRQPQLEHLTDEDIHRWLVRLLGRVDEKDGVFTTKKADFQLSLRELELLGLPEEVERWSQGSLFDPSKEASTEEASVTH